MTLTEIIQRLVPVLVFVASMSVVVNLSAAVGAITRITEILQRISKGSAWGTWWLVMLIATISTVFLSLDTTAILVTPLAIALAKRVGLAVFPLVLSVIWISNLGSLTIPVSNLTNLLSVSGGMFVGTSDYFSLSWKPALAATIVAFVGGAIAFILRKPPSIHRESRAPSSLDTAHENSTSQVHCLTTLGVLVPVLASPIPYWISSTVAAIYLLLIFSASKRSRIILSWMLIPWSSLVFVSGLSLVAFFLHTQSDVIAEGFSSLLNSNGMGPALLTTSGAILANLINNIPAFLALEPAATTPQSMMFLLIGVNAGPIVAPWASLATLLCLDQAKRNGFNIPWRPIILCGMALLPFAILLPLAATLI